MQKHCLGLGAVAVVALLAGCGSNTGTDGTGIVESVIDGDTITVRIGGTQERVRLIGIDTPETKKPDSPVECYGPQASAYASDLLPVGTRIRLERDTVGRDDYGRLLGYLYRLDDGLFINYEMLRKGYAQPLTIEPNSTYASEFIKAAQIAESDDLGLWAACGG